MNDGNYLITSYASYQNMTFVFIEEGVVAGPEEIGSSTLAINLGDPFVEVVKSILLDNNTLPDNKTTLWKLEAVDLLAAYNNLSPND